MSGEAGIKAFLWAIVVGMGFRIGWGLIGLLIDLVARSLAR